MYPDVLSRMVMLLKSIWGPVLYDPEDEDRDGLQNVSLYYTEPPHPADNPRKLNYTYSPGKHKIVNIFIIYNLLYFLGTRGSFPGGKAAGA
jgi:hypothetical protein